MLSAETRAELQRYVSGEISNAELADWLAGTEYDEALDQQERDQLAGIRLVLFEVEEGRRPAESVLDEVASVLAGPGVDNVVRAIRTGATTVRVRITEAGVTEGPSHVQRVHVGI